MDCRILINFSRKENALKADCLENTADVLLTPLRLACGKYVTVDPASKSPFLEQDQLFLIGRIFMGVVALAILPLTIIGLICASLSTSHQVTYDVYNSKGSLIMASISHRSLPIPQTKPANSSSIKKPLIATQKISPSSKTTITTPQVTDKPFQNINSWWQEQEKLPALNKDQILQSLNNRLKEWYDSPIDRLFQLKEKEETKPKESPQRILDKQIFAYVKSQRPNIATPDEFLWPLQGRRLLNPFPIGQGESFTPEDSQFYEFSEHSYPYLSKTSKPNVQQNYWAPLVKREKDKLYIYLDGGSYGIGVTVNDKYYPCQYGRGIEEPSILLKEGDELYSSGSYVSHICTVGKNGSVYFPPQKKIAPQRSEEGRAQAQEFFTQLAKKKEDGKPLKFVKGIKAAEIGFEPLQPGFCMSSTIFKDEIINTPENTDGEFVFIDFEKDKVLNDLATYLQAEFDVMQYSDEQKMMRLAHLAQDLFSEDIFGQSMNHNHYLGEILRSGKGQCRHRALLIKALADKLKLNCAYIVGLVDRICPVVQGGKIIDYGSIPNQDGHAWNVIQIGNKNYIVDSMNKCIFDVKDPPGLIARRKQSLLNFYGATHLSY